MSLIRRRNIPSCLETFPDLGTYYTNNVNGWILIPDFTYLDLVEFVSSKTIQFSVTAEVIFDEDVVQSITDYGRTTTTTYTSSADATLTTTFSIKLDLVMQKCSSYPCEQGAGIGSSLPQYAFADGPQAKPYGVVISNSVAPDPDHVSETHTEPQSLSMTCEGVGFSIGKHNGKLYLQFFGGFYVGASSEFALDGHVVLFIGPPNQNYPTDDPAYPVTQGSAGQFLGIDVGYYTQGEINPTMTCPPDATGYTCSASGSQRLIISDVTITIFDTPPPSDP